MIKVITSFSMVKVAEGKKIAYTYSVIDEIGNMIKNNERASFTVLDTELDINLVAIEDYLQTRLSTM